jgi:hypothetical protein
MTDTQYHRCARADAARADTARAGAARGWHSRWIGRLCLEG